MGKKISNFLKGEIVSSVFYIAFGLCLILIPDQTVNIICKVIFGLVMIAVGIYHIAIYAAEKEKATILDLFTGVIVLVLGVFLFFTPQIVVKILPYLLGAFVLGRQHLETEGKYPAEKDGAGTVESSAGRKHYFYHSGWTDLILSLCVCTENAAGMRLYPYCQWCG